MATTAAGHTTLPGLRVGPYGSIFSNLKVYSAALTPTTVNPNTTSEQTFTVTGLLADDIPIAVVKPTATTQVGIVNYRVSAANTLAIQFANLTATTTVPASETYTIVVVNSATN
jgi:hypothetical protein